MIAEPLLEVVPIQRLKLIDASGESYGWRVRWLRKESGMSRPQLAAAMADILGSMTATNLANLEGDKQRPYARTQAAIAQVFGIPESWLVTGKVPSDTEMAETIIRNSLFLSETKHRKHLYDTWLMLFEREQRTRKQPYMETASEVLEKRYPGMLTAGAQPPENVTDAEEAGGGAETRKEAAFDQTDQEEEAYRDTEPGE